MMPQLILLSPELTLTVIGALCTCIVGLAVHAFNQIKMTVERIESKIDVYEEKNASDHAKVDAALARLEEGVKSIAKDVDRHEKRIDELFDRNV